MSGNTSVQVQTNPSILVDLAIDFGSTNTVMAWKVYDVQAGGQKVRSKRYTDVDADKDGISSKSIPSAMIFKKDNPNNVAVQRDLYGEDARNAILTSNISPKVCDNFKQYLYTCPSDSADYKRGVELTTKFFEHLYREFRRSIYDRLPADKTKAVTLHLSTPVRANPHHHTLMSEIAEAAGFTPENGIREIITDCDEAKCVVQYAMAREPKCMKDLLALAKQKEVILLFVDVGGSTTDMNLLRLSISSNDKITMDSFSWWPNADVKYPLGGCLIDEAIRDYLIQEGFADKKYTLDWWERRDGKDRFRVFKEQNNLSLSQGECVEKLGNVKDACYDSDDEESDFEPRKYKNSPRRINDKIFREEICAKYITEMRNAIKAIFKGQGTVDGKQPVRPEDVDGILLSGAGSLLYFVRNVFLEEEMGFKKIQQNKSQLYTWDKPSLCCAEGALEESQANYLSYARDNYFVHFDIYKSDKQLFPGSCRLVKKHQMLPHSVQGNVSFAYTDTDFDDLTLRISLSRVDSSGKQTPVGDTVAWNVARNTGQNVLSGIKTAALLATAPLTLATAFVDGVLGTDVSGSILSFLASDAETNAKLSYACTLTESNQVKFRFSINGPFHHMDETYFEVTL